MAGLPPLMLHVGADEVLRDDSIGCANAAKAVGVEVQAHVWTGMTHVFPASVATLYAAREALDLSAAFIRHRLDSGGEPWAPRRGFNAGNSSH